jgi:hypothetical protein
MSKTVIAKNAVALRAARRRGERALVELFDRPEMLSGGDFAELLGVTPEVIDKKRKQHQILGIDGGKHGIRYPSWQVDATGVPVPGLSKVLSRFGNDSWAAYRFLMQHHARLGEMTGIEALKAGKRRAVIEATEPILSLDFS